MSYNSIIMRHQKIRKLLENTQNQPSKLRTKIWVKVKNELLGTYKVNSLIKFKTSMLRPSVCN